MEKAFKLDFENDKAGSLYVNCCGCSRTEGLHSFGPASKPHYLIHYVLSGRGLFRFHDKEYRLEAGYGFLIQPNELAFYQSDRPPGILSFPATGTRSCIPSLRT